MAGHASATVVSHLYEATIPVQDQGKDQRNQATQAAFTQVLARVSGRADVGDAQQFPAIAQATQTVSQFVQQFQYVKTDNGDNAQQPGLALWVRFDETAISHLLRASNLPVWGTTRPDTLVWLVVEQHGQRKMLSTDSRNDAYNILTAQAKLRGVPLSLPLLDLTDRTNIHVSDVWGNFGNTILQASQRYQTQVVLVGRVYQANSTDWVGRWSLYVDSSSENWTINGNSLADVLNTGIDRTAQSLALRYGRVDQEATSNVLVEVRQIKGLTDYNRAIKYLQSISHVKDVQPVELAPSSAIYRVTIPGGRLALSQGIALGGNVLASEPITDVPVESISTETAATTDTSNNAETVNTTTANTATANTATANTATANTIAANPTSIVNPAPDKVIPDLSYRLVQ